MSYTRFSSFIESKVTLEETLKVGWSKAQELQIERGAIPSDWYIYHHCDSGDGIEDQLLAIWSGLSEGTPLYSYDDLKEIAETKQWGSIDGYNLSEEPNKKLLIECVKAFISDCEFEEAEE